MARVRSERCLDPSTAMALHGAWRCGVQPTMVEVEVPTDVVEALGSGKDVEAEIRFAAATHLYHAGHISMGVAARMAGMGRVAYLEELGRRRLSVIAVDLDELRHELGRTP